MAKLSELFTNDKTQAQSSTPKNTTVKKIHYSKLLNNEAQYRDKLQNSNILPIAESILSVGILQPLIVTPHPTQPGIFVIVAGHTRAAAVRHLVEDKEQSGSIEYLPCIIKEYENDVIEELDLLSSNFHSTETPQEQSKRINRLHDIYSTHPEYLKGSSLRETLQNILGMSKTGVGEFITIKNNLSSDAKNQFNNGKISKRTAVELASLPKEEQKELIKQSKDTGLKLEDVKEYKSTRKTKVPINIKEELEQSETINSVPDAAVRHNTSANPYEIKDISNSSAAILSEKYKDLLTKSQAADAAYITELKMLITALDYYASNA